jgi:hypothetical protein
MREEFDHRQEMERLAKRLASGKAGPQPPLIQRGDEAVHGLGGPLADESDEKEGGPDPAKSS